MNLKDQGAKLFTALHRGIFHLTDGRLAGKLAGMTVVELITTGRKSGKPRSTMLTAPVVDGERIVLVASYGGDDRDPAWYRNLKTNPEVTAVTRGSRRQMVARTASQEEKDELWPRITSAYKGYAGYQKKTERNIPVVILDPK
jgi:deazaflavin-dependent oxidoreductase (nitroreductase family)